MKPKLTVGQRYDFELEIATVSCTLKRMEYLGKQNRWHTFENEKITVTITSLKAQTKNMQPSQ